MRWVAWPLSSALFRLRRFLLFTQARQASGRTLAVDRSGPTGVSRGTRIKVHWVGMDAWYEGTVTSQRAIDGAYDTRVFYDAVGSWRSHAAWHNLDNEEWDLL